MAIIINIDDYRKRKEGREEEPEVFGRILKSLGRWESEEERIRYYIYQAEKDLEEIDKLYPIPDDIAE